MKSDSLPQYSQPHRWLTILDYLYQASERSDGRLAICLGCNGIFCGECEKAEAPENIALLPYEDVYIYRRLKAAGIHVPMSRIKLISTRPKCPFLSNGRCSIRQSRPFDCRSYPIVPRFFGTHEIDFYLSEICPATRDVPRDFVALMKRLWKRIVPDLPEQWRVKYNTRNSHGRYRAVDAPFQSVGDVESRIA